MTSRANMNKNNRAYYQRHKEEILARRKAKREEYKDQLTKAKELLERFLDIGDLWAINGKKFIDLQNDVTQFLKESEVEK